MSYQKNFFKNIVNKAAIILLLIFFVNVLLAGYGMPEQQKRYIYIIGGAYKGGRVVKFKRTSLYSQHPWEIFAIEANPYVIDEIPKLPNLTVLNKAIWIKDGTIEFYLCPESDNLSSLYKGHLKKKVVPISVESIDFGQWLKSNFTKDDYIIVSFDIEGAEYEVLNKMLIDKTIQYIDLLLVEIHPKKLGKSKKEFGKLLKKINKLGTWVEKVDL